MSGWPGRTAAELNGTHFAEASEQTGVTETNDFISGAMHEALRKTCDPGQTLAAALSGRDS